MYNKAVEFLFNPLSAKLGRHSDRTKNAGFTAAALLLFFIYFLRYSGLADFRYLYYYVVGCVALGVMMLCSVRGPIQPVRFKLPLFIIWLLIGLLQFISGLHNSVDYLPEALLFLVVFPILFILWNNMGFETVFKLLIRACTLSFCFYIAVCFIFFPIEGAHYSGLFTNPNGAAEYLSLVFCCLLFEVFTAESRKKRIWSTVLIGVCTAFLFYSNSRTGQLSAILAFVCFVIMYVVTRGIKDKRFWISCAGVLLSSAVCCLGLYYVFELRGYIPLPVYDNVKNQFYYTGEGFNDFNSIYEVTEAKTAVSGRTADNVSSGRISIWQVFFSKLNLSGHKTGGYLYIPALKRSYSTCHNYVLQFAYDNGIFAGVAVAVYLVYSGINAIIHGLDNKKNVYALFPIIVSVAFGVTAMLSSNTVTFWYILLAYFYFVQGALITRTENAPKETDI